MLQHLLNKQMLAICVIIAVAVFCHSYWPGLRITQKRNRGGKKFIRPKSDNNKIQERGSAIFLATMIDVIIDYSNVFAFIVAAAEERARLYLRSWLVFFL